MRIIKFSLAAVSTLFASSLLPVQGLQAQTSVATNPVGFTTLTVNPKSGTTAAYTFLSLNLVRPVAYRGLVPSVGTPSAGNATVLTFPAGTFTDAQFNGAGNQSYLEVTNGTSAGFISNIQSTLASDQSQGGLSSITLSDDLSNVIASGTTTFLIRPHWTFSTAFGSQNSAGFQGSYSQTNADVIQLVNASTNGLTSYYFNTTNNLWQKGGVDASDVIIPPTGGLYIQRKNSTAVSIVLTGEVKLGTTGLPVVGGSATNVNLVSNPYALDSTTLSQCGLYTGSASNGLMGSYSTSTADTVGIFDPVKGGLNNYYFNTTNNKWQLGGVDASNVVIPSGVAVVITRKNSRPSFIWYVVPPAIGL